MNFQKRDLLYLSYGLIICMFVGIYWWSLPYDQLNMEDAFVQWSIFIIVASFIFRYFLKLTTYKLIVSSVIGIEMVIIVRFIYDKLDDSTRDPQIFLLLLLLSEF